MAHKNYGMLMILVFLLFTILEFSGDCRTLVSNENNVLQFGAVGDGNTDDTHAFLQAWKSVCGSGGSDVKLYVPSGKTFLLLPIEFQGPCNPSTITFQIDGKIVAPTNIRQWVNQGARDWLMFENIGGLHVMGSGVIDGQGAGWWPLAAHLKKRPRALGFFSCDNLVLSGLTHINSPSIHVHIDTSNYVSISNLQIHAPSDSPNTDGIDIGRCTNVWISSSNIGTGDDCIAIGGGSANINITNINCGPGHGISIGSLGANGERDTVEQVHVQHCGFKETTNGVRIKTWQGGSGYAKEITFEDITLDSVSHPIIINQYYCDNHDCSNQTTAVEVSNVIYRGIRGTSASDVAMQLSCSETVGCTGLVFDDVNITSSDQGEQTYASCTNAHGRSFLSFPSLDCLLP